jgi:hypothetical protein
MVFSLLFAFYGPVTVSGETDSVRCMEVILTWTEELGNESLISTK